MRAQADADLVIPDLNRMVPEAAAPCRRIGNLVDVVDQDVDMVDLLSDARKQRSDVGIVAVVTLNGNAATTGFGDQSRRGIDGALAAAGGATGNEHGAAQFAKREGDSLADAAAGAGDHRYFSSQAARTAARGLVCLINQLSLCFLEWI